MSRPSMKRPTIKPKYMEEVLLEERIVELELINEGKIKGSWFKKRILKLEIKSLKKEVKKIQRNRIIEKEVNKRRGCL